MDRERASGREPKKEPGKKFAYGLLWVSGSWVLPPLVAAFWLLPGLVFWRAAAIAAAVLLAPLPALLYLRRRSSELSTDADNAREQAVQIQLELDTVRSRNLLK